jgi:hypothetical protein
MTDPEQTADAGPLDRLADGAAGEHGIPGRGKPGARGAAPVGAPLAPGAAAADAAALPVAGFAARLRELRERAGRPSYRQLAQVTHYSHTVLSQAAAGRSLPSLAVTQAFVRACGGDVDEWSARWREAERAVRQPAEPPRPPGPCPPVPSRARADSVRQPAAGWLRARGGIAIAAAVITAAACITAAVLWAASSTTATGLPGQAGTSPAADGAWRNCEAGYACLFTGPDGAGTRCLVRTSVSLPPACAGKDASYANRSGHLVRLYSRPRFRGDWICMPDGYASDAGPVSFNNPSMHGPGTLGNVRSSKMSTVGTCSNPPPA